MSKPVFWEKREKYFELSSAEIFTQPAKRYIKQHHNETPMYYFLQNNDSNFNT